jgi:hypothetical protein
MDGPMADGPIIIDMCLHAENNLEVLLLVVATIEIDEYECTTEFANNGTQYPP